jgi:hypothetical protein
VISLNPQVVGALLVHHAGGDESHHLPFPGRQSVDKRLQIPDDLFVGAAFPVALQGGGDGVEEILIAERLGQELNIAALHRLHRHGNISIARDEDDWDLPVRRSQFALKIKAALPRQSDVEHQASWTVRPVGLKKLGDGRKLSLPMAKH